ncbi:hypothetical protein DL546_006338 [Coniochaeta pulveracea]|uniref:Protein kinase domain-containing protein n=1 Tax=Coniochaeta pulveracea TaxID=177199 RepID=A0A420Y793_9PEZI|nr:hypothetical protein DL546_006338 [Coniochaeta pulveracea]
MVAENGVLVDTAPRLHLPARHSEIQLPRYRRPGEPERYRLSAGRLAITLREPPTKLIHFRFCTRYVSAHAAQISDLHPHVLGLQLCPSTMASFFTYATRFLPAFAQSWIHSVFPEWFLPDRAVLKIQKPGEDQEIMEEYFDTEVRAYQQLNPLQGSIIPKFYGVLRYDGTRAMLLEYVGGISLSAPDGATMTLEELSSLLQPCYRALHALGVHQDDANLSNFQLVDGKIKVLDLESAVFHYCADQRATFLASSVRHLAKHYLSMQAYYRHQGFLEAA